MGACEIILVVALFGGPNDYSVEARCMPSFEACVKRSEAEWIKRPDGYQAIVECVVRDGMVGMGPGK